MGAAKVVVCSVCALVVGAAAGAGSMVLARRDNEPAAAVITPVSTAKVTRTDLVSRTDEDGTLGFKNVYTISGPATGVITWLPDEGDVIKRGKPVYQVNGVLVPLFYGTTPFWRTLKYGVDDGADVEILERNLEALGYGDDLTVDEEFDSETTAAVEEWQEDLGVSETGVFKPSSVVLKPGGIRVSEVEADLGDTARGPLLQANDGVRQVTVAMPVADQDLAKIGGKVRVKLPGGVTTTGKITSIGTTATAGSDSSGNKAQTGQAAETATVPVYITLDKPRVAGKLDGAPVTVGFTSATRKGVLTVPVSALLANSDGTYAVAAVDGGRHWTIPVKLGVFADSQVEVSGSGLAPGMKVEVPKA